MSKGWDLGERSIYGISQIAPPKILPNSHYGNLPRVLGSENHVVAPADYTGYRNFYKPAAKSPDLCFRYLVMAVFQVPRMQGYSWVHLSVVHLVARASLVEFKSFPFTQVCCLNRSARGTDQVPSIIDQPS